MMVSENRNKISGFTFIEVMIAITVFALLATTLLSLQGNLLKRAIRNFSSWHAVITLKNSLYEGKQNQWFRDNNFHTQEKLPYTTTYQIRAISEKSALKHIKNLRAVQATATWKTFGFDRREQFVSYICVPDVSEEKT